MCTNTCIGPIIVATIKNSKYDPYVSLIIWILEPKTTETGGTGATPHCWGARKWVAPSAPLFRSSPFGCLVAAVAQRLRNTQEIVAYPFGLTHFAGRGSLDLLIVERAGIIPGDSLANRISLDADETGLDGA